MKITVSEPVAITLPPTTYTLVLTEREMQGLRALALNGSKISIAEHRGRFKSDGNPAYIHETLSALWAEINQFIGKWAL